MDDYYSILGVKKAATADDIKSAYRKLAQLHHPDKGGDTAVFSQINQAYDTLSDSVKRKTYDGRGGMYSGRRIDQDILRSVVQRRVTAHISLRTAALGGACAILVGTGRRSGALEIELPGGVETGDTFGIRTEAGTYIVTLVVDPDPVFSRVGLDLYRNTNVSIWDLFTGGTTTIEDIRGKRFTLTIPEGTQPGSSMKMKSLGVEGETPSETCTLR